MLDFRRHRKGVDEIALRGADHLVRRFLCVTFAGALFTALAFGAQVPRKSPARNIPHLAHPKLVVMIVVDQMRGDYVDKFRGQWTGGLKRLVEEGAWFREAAYPYAATETRAAAVYRAEDLSGLDSGGSQIRTALTLDYFHGRSGDQFIVPRPYWHVHGSPAGKKAGGGTGHGTPYNYDQHVPLLLCWDTEFSQASILLRSPPRISHPPLPRFAASPWPRAMGASWRKLCTHARPNNSTSGAGFFGWTRNFVLFSPEREFF